MNPSINPTRLRKMIKLMLVIALAKHSLHPYPKSKDKHIELPETKQRRTPYISLVLST